MRTELVIRFGYGVTVPWTMRLDDGTRRAVAGPDMVLLRTAVPLRGEDLKTANLPSMPAKPYHSSLPTLASRRSADENGWSIWALEATLGGKLGAVVTSFEYILAEV